MSKWLLTANFTLALLLVSVLALIASDLASYKLGQVFPQGTRKQATTAPPPAPAEDLAAYAPILEKGLFGKATEGKLTPITQAAPEATPSATSEKDLLLLGTVVGSFRETFALILKQSTKEERVFRLGDKVFDIGSLVAVKKETAEILAGGQRIKIAVPMAAGEADKGAAPPQPPPPGGGIASQVGSGSYVVDQRALNAALDNMGQVMSDARLLPSIKDGKVEGFRASEVKPSGVFGMVGIKNGDVLLRINDFPIDSPEKAIQSFVTLKGQSRIKLDIVRDGRPTTFNYDIR